MLYCWKLLTLKIRCSPASIAVNGDLGWLPILDHMDIQRVSYYAHLVSMPDSRLPKTVYKEMVQAHSEGVNVPFDYINSIKDIFNDKGLDYMFNDVDKICVQTFKRFTTYCYQDSFFRESFNMPSLKYYRAIKDSTNMSEYLVSKMSFSKIRLKFKLRTGVSGLGEDLYRQHRGQGLCPACGQFETLKHVLFYCRHYTEARLDMFDKIRNKCGMDVFINLTQNQDYAIASMLGDHNTDYSYHCMDFMNHVFNTRGVL